MSATYLSAAVGAQLAEAQTVIDVHLSSSQSGVCTLCGQVEPCQRRVDAERLFARYGRLPRRTPGLTFADASRWSRGLWFGERS